MKRLLLLAAFLSSWGAAQDFTQRITLRATAQPAPKLVKDLAARTGLPLRASDSVARDIVLLKISDVTAREAMDRLAGALDASWVTRDGFQVLTRTSKQEVGERTAERAQRLADLQRYVKRTTARWTLCENPA